MRCIYGVLNIWCSASLLYCIFGALQIWWIIYLSQYELHLRCLALLVLCIIICTFGMHWNLWCAESLVRCNFGELYLGCNIYLVYCIFGALHLWCYVYKSAYMQFWYALHRQLWWCLFGVITIVQCIFGALFLGLGCNIFLVLRLWCYALSAISRRLATAVAHLLYVKLSLNQWWILSNLKPCSA